MSKILGSMRRNKAGMANTLENLERHLRQLGVEEPVTHRWAGTMGFTDDELPLVGAVPGMPGVYVCGGYTGHGFWCWDEAPDDVWGLLHHIAP